MRSKEVNLVFSHGGEKDEREGRAKTERRGGE